MRLATSVIILFAMSVAAVAAPPECRSISRTTGQLACSDRAAPPVGKQNSSASGSALTRSGRGEAGPALQSVTPWADRLGVENSQVNAKIKTICRGC